MKSILGPARLPLPVLGAILLLSTPALAQAPLQNFGPFIEQTRREWNVPGVAVAVVKDDKIVFIQGYGVRTQGQPAAVDANTAFQLASVTKTFTAAALGTLVDEGKLGWDDPILNYLPGFAMHDPYATLHTSARDLLAHRSGLPAFGGDLLNELGYTRAEVVRRLRLIEPAGSFRERAGYSNLGFTLAGTLAGQVAGSSWEAVVRSRLLDPLGMTRTRVVAAELKSDPNAATPHLSRPAGPVPMTTREGDGAFGPAGAMSSSANDMATWIRMLLAGGSLGGKQVLRPETVKELFQPTMVSEITFSESPPINENTGFDYTLGWASYAYNGRKVIEKGGALAGVRSVVTLVPSEHLGVVVLANLNLTLLPEVIRAWVLESYLGPAGRDLGAEFRQQRAALAQLLAAVNAPPTTPAPFTRSPDAYVGVYENELYGRLAVVREGSGLAVKAGPACYQGNLQHEGHDAFALGWPRPNSLPGTAIFAFDANGKVVSLLTEDDGVFMRVESNARDCR
ncbi:serine hydrolase [Deinococcus humi]|uniref:CubicO group peptidase (Beta-lactamase class C family) n=1 Tax=Deinococcus humi TaxID=662880 RepID=A0A7W8K040_9DEIO|nr:serine hydrolase [Deinococcus humi]MBB5366349.1 CubicO group peptidase (beta-lactamase class C family) [Deinococcus humi]GGO41393.1 serine hydrolase [Deinococcus humi]